MRGATKMVPARNLRMNAELGSCGSGLRGAALPQQLQLPARRLACGRAGGAGEGARLRGARHHRRMFARGRGARALGREEDRRQTSKLHRSARSSRSTAGCAWWSSRATAPDTGGCRGSSRAAGARRGEGQLFAHARRRRRIRRRSPNARHARAVAAAARADAAGQGEWIARTFAGRAWIAVELTARRPRSRAARALPRASARTHGLPLTAAGDVHMHVRERRRLQDALTAVRHGVTVARGGHAAASQWRTPPARARAARRGSIHPSCWPKP